MVELGSNLSLGFRIYVFAYLDLENVTKAESTNSLWACYEILNVLFRQFEAFLLNAADGILTPIFRFFTFKMKIRLYVS